MRIFLTSQINSLVLDRLNGMEIESPYYFLFKVFRTAKIKNMLADPEDDTNDDAKWEIEEFLKKVGDDRYFAFLDDWNNLGKSFNSKEIGRLLDLDLDLRQGNITPDEYEEALKEEV